MSLRVGLAVMLGGLLSSAPAVITFEAVLPLGNSANHVDQTPDGGYILNFNSEDSTQAGSALLRTDSLGNVLWWRAYRGPDGSVTLTDGSCLTRDGQYVLASSQYGYETATRVDSVGDTIWTYVYHTGSLNDFVYSVTATADSGCVMTGRLSEGSEYGMALLKLSRNGEREWLKVFCPPGMSTQGLTAWETDDRGFIVNGVIEEDTGGIRDDYLVRTDSAGETLWTVRYRPEIPGYPGGWFGSVCVTADGGFAICGTAATLDRHRPYVARFDSAGVNLWTRVLFDSSPFPDHLLLCVQATPDRGFVVVGAQLARDSTSGIILVRLDSLGDTLWTRLFGGLAPLVPDWGLWVVNTRDGGFAVGGEADGHSVYLIKTDSMGLVYSAVNEGAPARPMQSGLTAQPNPFRAGVAIRCALAGREPATLRIYDQTGRPVREFPALDVKLGTYSVTWDGRDARGRLLASGIYFVRLKAGDHSATEKLVLQR
jgi:hypothetical protein